MGIGWVYNGITWDNIVYNQQYGIWVCLNRPVNSANPWFNQSTFSILHDIFHGHLEGKKHIFRQTHRAIAITAQIN